MKALSENRRAFFDYEVLEKFEAGIELKGLEVKSSKLGRLNIAGSFALSRATSRGGAEFWLINADIPPYQPNNTPADYNPKRSRRLLLTSKEIKYLLGKLTGENLTLVPLRVYTKRGLIKIELGLVRPKKKYDKRETIKKREAKKEIARTLKS